MAPWASVTAIDRDRGDLLIETIEPEPRAVRPPASFWNAKGRRRVALSYCRTIHRAQGSTCRGASFTLASDDTIHLEAVHVALSRATEANHLYYSGEPPADEDHHVVEVAEPELESLLEVAGRSRAQVMALDLLQGVAASPEGGTGGGGTRWTEAPMTEAQVATLERHGLMQGRYLTWVQASLLIDQVTGSPAGKRAMAWLRENGAGDDEAAQVIERAAEGLRAARRDRGIAGRVEVDRPAQAAEVRERQRDRRRDWAQSGEDTAVVPAVSHANRMRLGRSPPRAGP